VDRSCVKAVQSVVDALQGGKFLFASLALGLLLYQLDLPMRARLARVGDPANQISLPSKRLEQLLTGPALMADYESLYFLLTDAHLPPETHRRIYFFGVCTGPSSTPGCCSAPA
jgi:hypothetical protein